LIERLPFRSRLEAVLVFLYARRRLLRERLVPEGNVDVLDLERIEESLEAVVVVRRNRIVLVVVTPRAPDGQPEKPGAGCAGDIVYVELTILQRRNASCVPRAEAQEGRGDVALRILGQDQAGPALRISPGQLPHHELVVGHVRVERVDDPI